MKSLLILLIFLSAPSFAQDKGVVVNLENGKQLVLKNSTDDPNNYKRYEYIKYLPEIKHHLIDLFYYEGSVKALISNRTGKEITIIGEPNISPDGKRIVSVSASIAYTNGGVMVHKLSGDEYEQEYFLREDGTYQFEKWISSSEFVLKNNRYTEDACEKGGYVWVPEIFSLGANGWISKMGLEKHENCEFSP